MNQEPLEPGAPALVAAAAKAEKEAAEAQAVLDQAEARLAELVTDRDAMEQDHRQAIDSGAEAIVRNRSNWRTRLRSIFKTDSVYQPEAMDEAIRRATEARDQTASELEAARQRNGEAQAQLQFDRVERTAVVATEEAERFISRLVAMENSGPALALGSRHGWCSGSPVIPFPRVENAGDCLDRFSRSLGWIWGVPAELERHIQTHQRIRHELDRERR